MKALKHLNTYFYKYRLRLIVGVLITIGAKIFALFTPKLIGEAITIISNRLNNSITDPVFRDQLTWSILMLVGAACFSGLLTFLMRQTIINVSRLIEYDLKNDIYSHYQKLSLRFYKSNRTGDLLNRITEDVSQVRSYAGPALMYTINTVTLFIVALIYMWNAAPKLTLYTIIPLPILSIIIYNISKTINLKSKIVQEYLSKLSTFSQETFSGISVIKSYVVEGKKHSAFQKLSDDSREKQINLSKVQALFFPSMILLIGCSNIIVTYVGGVQYINGEIEDIGTIAAFLIYVNMLTWPVATVGWVTSIVQQAEASQNRINEFLNRIPEITNPSETPFKFTGKIEFRNVSFTYPETGIKALDNVSFTLNPGETLAVLGKTGSGKSTLLELICRLYDTDSGEILIDDQPITTINLNALRSQMGFVPQDPFLFSESIKNNILFGKHDGTLEDVIQASKMADVHKNIEKFKAAYDTVLGERGITLSGGQKQRVSIARAVIGNPKMLLLDDCLSAVDTETEEIILGNLENLSEDKTTIIVGHRVSFAKNADIILVLDHGKTAEIGTHKSLYKQDGYYTELYNSQITQKEIS